MAERIDHYQVPRTLNGRTYGFRALCDDKAVRTVTSRHLTADPNNITCGECRAIYEEALTKCQDLPATVAEPQSGGIE